ncbi:unnamed protein product, partial [Vitis vinifera]
MTCGFTQMVLPNHVPFDQKMTSLLVEILDANLLSPLKQS